MSNYYEATPESQGIGSEVLQNLLDELQENVPTLQQLAVIKNGKVILKASKKPYRSTDIRCSYSMAKSYVSMAIGILVTDQTLDVHEKCCKYFSDYYPNGYDKRFDYIEIADLLRMNACCLTSSCDFGNLDRDEWLKFYLSYTLPRDVGTGFQYDTGATYALSALVTMLTGQTVFELLYERIFLPLEIHDVKWKVSPEGFTVGGWALYMSLDDQIKIAKLWMNYGNWQGRQLISEQYMRQATAVQTSTDTPQARFRSNYGYLFWLGDGVFSAMGAWGCMINCCIERGIAVIVGAVSNDELNNKTIEILYRYLFQNKTLDHIEENPAALTELIQQIENMVLPYPTGVRSNDEAESKIFGQMLYLDDNDRDIRGIYFSRKSDDIITMNLLYKDRNVPFEAAYQEWRYTEACIKANFIFDNIECNDFHDKHALSYAWDGNTLLIIDYLLNTNNYDLYRIEIEENEIRASVQVTTKRMCKQTSPDNLIIVRRKGVL